MTTDMKQIFTTIALALTVGFAATDAEACTSLLVGKKASADVIVWRDFISLIIIKTNCCIKSRPLFLKIKVKEEIICVEMSH